MTTVGFLIPGDLDLPTGGYAYDRALIAHLPAFGVAPIHVELSGRFPDPTMADLEACAARVATLPEGTPLLVDGLAYGAMPVDLIRRFGRPVVALCHHPLALETGLSAERSARLRASETQALALARRVIVTSPATGRLLVEAYAVPAERIDVAPPGTACKPRATGSGGSRVEILAVGAVVPRKGYDLLIEALSRLADRDWRASHLRAGGGAAPRPSSERSGSRGIGRRWTGGSPPRGSANASCSAAPSPRRTSTRSSGAPISSFRPRISRVTAWRWRKPCSEDWRS